MTDGVMSSPQQRIGTRICNPEMIIRNTSRYSLFLVSQLSPTFSEGERSFLVQNEACRIATSYKDSPHVVPVSYIFDKNSFFIAIGYGDKKYKNLKKNNNIALVVDVYNSSADNKAIMITGEAAFVTAKAEFDRLYKIFSRKFEWYKLHPWSRHEGTFVRIRPKSKTSWGIDQNNI